MDTRIQELSQHLEAALSIFPVQLKFAVEGSRCSVLIEYPPDVQLDRPAVLQTISETLSVFPPPEIRQVMVFGRQIGESAPEWRKSFAIDLSHSVSDLSSEAPSLSSTPISISGTTASPRKESEGLILSRRYRVLQVLGAGGFSRTYLAQDLQRPGNPVCVVKQLELFGDESDAEEMTRKLFNREAETLERLGQNSQIPQLLAYFEEEGHFYLIEEYIQGHPLTDEIAEQPFTEEKTKELLIDLLTVLDFIHENHIIHSDIKPDNIIRRQSDGKPVLIDFGAVKQLRLDPNQERRNTVALGTIGYAPIEQYTGQPQLNSDLYALGMVTLECLTGLAPTEFGHDGQTGEITWQDRLPEPVSATFAAIVSKMIRIHFNQRYQSASEVIRDLESGKAPQVIPPSQSLPGLPGIDLAGATILARVWNRKTLIATGLGSAALFLALLTGQFFKLRGDTVIARQSYQEGIQQGQLERLRSAAQAFRVALDHLPIYPQAQVALDQSQTQLNSLAKTIEQNRAFLQSQPTNTHSRIELGVALYRNGDSGSAINELTTALVFAPNNAFAVYQLGRAQAQERQWDKAIASYRRALQLNPSLVEAQIYLGLALIEKGDRKGATQVLQSAIQISPSNALAHYYAGQAYAVAEQWTPAVDRYLRALELNPGYRQTRRDLGYGLYAPGQIEKAIRSSQEAAKSAPKSSDPPYRLGNAFRAAGQLDQAEAAYRQALQVSGTNSKAMVGLGLVELERQRWDQAVARFEDAVQINRGDSEAQKGLGIALAGQAEARKQPLNRAIQQLQAAVRINPDDATIRQQLGVTLAEAGQTQAGVDQLQEAAELNPNNSDTRTFLGVYLSKQDRHTEASQQLNAALSTDPANPAAHLALANTQAQQGKVDQALDQAQVAAALEKSQPQAESPARQQAYSSASSELYSEVVRQKNPNGKPDPKTTEKLANEDNPAAAVLNALVDQKVVAPQDLSNPLGGQPVGGGVPMLINLVGSSLLIVAVLNLLATVGVGTVWGLQMAGVVPTTFNRKYGKAIQHCRRGLALVKLQKRVEAVAEFKAAIKIEPNLVLAHYHLGECWLELKKLEEAIAEFWVVKNLAPEYHELNARLIEVLFMLANQLIQQKEFDRAVEQFRFILSLYPEGDPGRSEVHFQLGEALINSRNSRNWELGIEELKVAIKLDPYSVKAHEALGRAYLLSRDFKSAIAACQKILNLDPGSVEARFLMGQALYGQGQLQPAIQQYETILAQDPKLTKVKAELALALLQTGSVMRAKQEVTEILARERHGKAMFTLASIMAIEGQLDEATLQCEQAIKQDPGIPAATALLGLIFLEQKRKDAGGRRFIHHRNINLSQVKFEAAIKQDIHVAEAHYGLGEIARMKRELVNAIDSYSIAIKSNGSYTAAHYKLGSIFYQMGNFSRAIEELQTTLRLNPNHPEAESLLRKCIAGSRTKDDYVTSIVDTSLEEYTSVNQVFT